nr:putative reverse transcriptase domain-containing protein [Tanacetum cinerariifolium]
MPGERKDVLNSIINIASRLYIGDTHIWSATGVQQDDPLEPLLFALILHPLLHKIKDNCKLLLHAWYLDDETVIGDSEEVARVIDIIKAVIGCEAFVSRDTYFISGLAMRRTANAFDLMSLLSQLHDPQSELLLLRSCMGIVKLFFGIKTCKHVHMEEAALFFDKGLRGSIENIVVCGGPFFGDLQWRLASLPIRFGGLGLYSAKLVSSYAFEPRGPNLGCYKTTSYVTVAYVKAVFACLRAPHAHDFLLAIPIDGLGQHMLPVEYQTILKYRLMIPLFPVDAICPICRKACLDSFGKHAVHCKELIGFKY